MNYPHTPVLLEEVLENLDAARGGCFLDGTLGMGGHAEAILNASSATRLCGLDRDGEALAIAKKRLEPFGERASLFHMPFSDFARALQQLGWQSLDGALLDLGVSSLQLDRAERGFSFKEAGPLDMRMDQEAGSPALEFVNQADYEELRQCIATLGEDPQAARIAKRIIAARARQPIADTETLANVVRQAYPPVWKAKARRDPATRTFQAIRLKVNDEPGQLRSFLEQILKWLAPGGRLVIISFHSLEDRIVKNAFRSWAAGCICGPAVTVCKCGHMREVRILHKKPVVASITELAANPRASSAKLRAVEKLMVKDNASA